MQAQRKCGSVVALAVVTLASAGLAGAQGVPTEEKLGKVHFETSCAPAVSADFDHAMALLHSFEFPASIAGFQGVLKADPSCGIAEWGIAMATWGNPFAGLRAPRVLKDGLAAVGRAQSIGAKTEREREYISAVALLYTNADTQDHRARTLAYELAMEKLHKKYPKDLEAAAFYALSVDQTALPTDKTNANLLKAAAILEDLFKLEPEHPGITHYLIHSYDVPPLAARGLPYARRYADLAPAAPHALHMPAHTFTRVGSWQESIDTNVRSHDTALALKDSGAALHAMDYMAYAYLQTAQDTAAKRVLDELEQMVASQPSASPGQGPGGGFPGAAIPARWALERGMWADAAKIPVRPAAQPYMEAMTHFARALGAARTGQPDAVKTEVDQLTLLRDKEIAAKDEVLDDAGGHSAAGGGSVDALGAGPERRCDQKHDSGGGARRHHREVSRHAGPAGAGPRVARGDAARGQASSGCAEGVRDRPEEGAESLPVGLWRRSGGGALRKQQQGPHVLRPADQDLRARRACAGRTPPRTGVRGAQLDQ